jgi:hypothetical protein
MSERTQQRDDSGKYTFDGDLDRLCVCGHSLGLHSGRAPHDCLTYSLSKTNPDHAECDCQKFQPQRRKKG